MRGIFQSILFVILGLASAHAQSQRIVLPLNADWRFQIGDLGSGEAVALDDSNWSAIHIPHSWNAPVLPFARGYYRGVGWYRKHLPVTAIDPNRKTYLKFYAVDQEAEVFVNGQNIGRHAGGFTAFAFDVTKNLKLGDNVIAVRVSNAFNPNIAPVSADFTFFGGIYREAELITTANVNITPLDYASPGVYVTPSSVTKELAKFKVLTKFTNASKTNVAATVEITVKDRAGQIVLSRATPVTVPTTPENLSWTYAENFELANPHLWNGRQDPYLYQVILSLKHGNEILDQVIQNFGLRSYAVHSEDGLFLNGKHLELKGVNLHQDWQGMGWAITDKERLQNIAILSEMGVNAVRLAHYPNAPQNLNLMDQNGFVVWAELPMVNEVTATPEFQSSTETQLTEMIRQQYNHPSILFWSLYNELKPDPKNPSVNPYAMVDRLQKIAKFEDPTRLTTGASQPSPTKPSDRHVDLLAVNRYDGWYGGNPASIGPALDKLHKTLPKISMGLSEYGAGAGIHFHEENLTAPTASGHFHPEEYQCHYHETYYRELQKRPYIWGHFVWNIFDFSSPQRHEGERDGLNDKGLATYDRKTKKDAFYFYKAHWNPAPMVYITGRRFTIPRAKSIDVKVYANTPAFVLTINGVPVKQFASRPDDVTWVWKGIKLAKGKNVVRAEYSSTVFDTLEWTGPLK